MQKKDSPEDNNADGGKYKGVDFLPDAFAQVWQSKLMYLVPERNCVWK